MRSITKKDPECIINSTHDGMIAVSEDGTVILSTGPSRHLIHPARGGNGEKAAGLSGKALLNLYGKINKYDIQ